MRCKLNIWWSLNWRNNLWNVETYLKQNRWIIIYGMEKQIKFNFWSFEFGVFLKIIWHAQKITTHTNTRWIIFGQTEINWRFLAHFLLRIEKVKPIDILAKPTHIHLITWKNSPKANMKIEKNQPKYTHTPHNTTQHLVEIRLMHENL